MSLTGIRNTSLVAAACAAIGLLATGGQSAMAQAQCASVVDNLVLNCGFETVTGINVATNWTTGGTGVSRALTSYSHTGNRSMVSVFDTPGDTFVSQLVGGPGTYDVSFWLDLYSQGVPSNPLPTINITLGNQVLNVNPTIDNRQNPQYTQFQFFNVTTTDPALLQFETSGDRPSQSVQYVNFLVDDVVVVRRPTPS